ncbi:rod shape-determining protein MreD [Metabacillus iocasae]|uniref:Rod shape-determining protein MreD n=1 Tax=Priestia iocasae TaxID=2291674 RepID=A0ABS2QQX3_9BACI|nr:rod shape-determining protein MreD [Metabacillus iocasae]MBM7701367.1 rod shape-determining protein MreD [Metabacillus iocasae]
MTINRFFLPFLVSAVFIGESMFVNFIAGEPSLREWVLSPRFVVIILIFMTVYFNVKQGMVYGLIFGMLYDVAFTDILGVYMLGIPAVCYLASKMMKIFQNNALIVSLLALFAVTIIEFYIYGINVLIHVTDMTFDRFLQQRFYATMILNALFCFVFSYPLKAKLQKWKIQLLDERL